MTRRGRPTTNRVGQTFGRLEVLSQERRGDTTWARCSCRCGKAVEVRMASLVSGKTRSCGCLVPDTRVSPITDRTGQRYGKLVAIRPTDRRDLGGGYYWLCKCDCGNDFEVRGGALETGNTRSCGCLHAEVMASQTYPGRRTAPEYAAWRNMIQRCTNPKDERWVDYGGRGIAVCQRWLESYDNFLTDVGKRPADDLSLDRIDNDGNYEPTNVRWATRQQQMLNRRRVGDREKIITQQQQEIDELRAKIAEMTEAHAAPQ